MRALGLFVLGLVVGAAAAAGVGYLVLSKEDEDAGRDATGRITRAGPLDVFELRTGDCLRGLPRGESVSLPTVPCADRHRGEVVATMQLPGGAWPGHGAVRGAGARRCAAALRARRVGRRAESFFFAPSQRSWRQGDRLLTCVARLGRPRRGALGE